MADEGKLTDEIIAGLGVGIHSDGKSLTLTIKNGKHGIGRYWAAKILFEGKYRSFSFGKYPNVTINDARQCREDAFNSAKAGVKPTSRKSANRLIPGKTKINVIITLEIADRLRLIGGGSANRGILNIIDEFMEFQKHKREVEEMQAEFAPNDAP